MKILLIDDNRFDRTLVLRELHKEFPELMANEILDAAAMETALADGGFDLVITDYQLQWTTGTEVLRAVKQRFPDCPVIMFTGTGNELIAVEAMKAGLDDYVVKSAKHFVRLPVSVKQALEKDRLRKAEREAARTIAHLHAHRELILSSVADGILGVDNEGRHSFANPAVQQMLGYPLDELLGRDSHSLWHHSYHDGSPYPLDRCPVHSSLREKKTVFGKDFFWRKDGSGFMAEYTTAPIHENGICRGAVIVFRDITAQEAAQEELRKYRQIVSASEEHMAFVGPDLVVQAVNNACLEAYQWQRDDVIGHSVSDLLAGERFGSAMVNGLEQARHGESAHFRDWFDIPALGRRYMDVSCYPYRSEKGNITGVVINARDITDLKQQEDALRLAEQEWQRTFDSISDLVSIHDSQFRFLKVNKALANFVGKPAEELVGKHCYEILHGLNHPWVECPHQMALTQGCPITRDIDDPQIGCPMLVTASPIVDERGRVMATVHIAKDISEIRKAEQERLNLQTQLTQAQKMECVGHLVGGVAHDFNNLLSAIIGFSDLILLQFPDMPGVTDNIKQIKEAGVRSAALIRQLLSFSRKQVLEMAPVQIDTIVENLGKMLRRLIGEEIVLDCQLETSGSVIFADPVQIEQIVINLVVNARDAMPDGGRITIRTTPVSLDEGQTEQLPSLASGSYVLLTISDTGAGIKPEDRPRLFEPFFTTKGIGKGTGLGLATVYGIVTQHKGWVDFESEVGAGTTFRVFLPVASQYQQQVLGQTEDIPLPQGRETILVVDDDPIFRKIICNFLVFLGYKVLEAASVKEALQLAELNLDSIDLLMTDVVLPEQRGTSLAELLSNRSPRLKTLFMSGYADDRIAHEGILNPGVNFFSKPATLRKVSEMVRCVLDVQQ